MHVAGVQVFDGEVSLLELLMIPVEEDETAAYTVRSLPEDFDIPTHKLFEGGESSRPHPAVCLPPRAFWTSPSSPKRSRYTWAAPRPMCRT